jgi:D-sedoheptulose 7-phosphate isomerase
MKSLEEIIHEQIHKSSEVINNCVENIPDIIESINKIVSCMESGNKIVIFGNGGSAADSQHMAAEFIGRYKLERKSLPAIALTTDSSILTSIGNDYSFSEVFSRQCESMVNTNDVVIGISTSGKSENVRKGLLEAKKREAVTIGILGKDGGNIKDVCDISIIVKEEDTPKIQEAHRVIIHIICETVEEKLKER